MTRSGGDRAWLWAILAGTVLVVLAGDLACSKSGWKGTITKEGDVTVVSNPKKAIYPTPILELEEDFVLGGKDAGEESALSMPMDVACDEEGSIYVADGREANIKVFGSDGKPIRTIGRRGQGPGEFQFPRRLSIVSETDEIVVFDLREVMIFGPEGAFLRKFPLKMIPVQILADKRGRLVVATSDPRTGTTVIERRAPDMSGAPVSIVAFAEDPRPIVFAPRAWWTLDDGGRVLFGYPRAYEIEVYDPDGKVFRRIRREYDPVKVAPDERADLTERTRKVLGPEAAAGMSFADSHSAYRSFFADDEGHLFVQTWERTPDGKADIHDVFDAEGRFLSRVPMPVHPDFQAPLPRVMKKRKLYTIEPDEEGYEVVKRYSVTWKVK